MSKFTYRRGTWEDGHLFPECEEKEEYKHYLARIGYASDEPIRFGHVDANHVSIYEHYDNSTFFADVVFANGRCFEVFLPDFPSVMQFIKEHANVFSAEEANITQQEILELLQKLFQAHHGHAPHEICQACSPKEWVRFQELRTAGAERK